MEPRGSISPSTTSSLPQTIASEHEAPPTKVAPHDPLRSAISAIGLFVCVGLLCGFGYLMFLIFRVDVLQIWLPVLLHPALYLVALCILGLIAVWLVVSCCVYSGWVLRLGGGERMEHRHADVENGGGDGGEKEESER